MSMAQVLMNFNYRGVELTLIQRFPTGRGHVGQFVRNAKKSKKVRKRAIVQNRTDSYRIVQNRTDLRAFSDFFGLFSVSYRYENYTTTHRHPPNYLMGMHRGIAARWILWLSPTYINPVFRLFCQTTKEYSIYAAFPQMRSYLGFFNPSSL